MTIEGVGGGFGATVNLVDPARLLILNESDLTMEYSKTVSGTINVSGLTDENKIILVREANSGETFGYGSVTPIQLGPLIPFIEPFDGPAGTQPDTDLWLPINGVENYMGLDGSGILTDLVNMGGLGDSFYYNFAYQLDGQFEIEARFTSDGSGGNTTWGSNYTRIQVINDSGDIYWLGTISTSNFYNWKQGGWSISGNSLSENDVLLNTSDYLSWYKIWRTPTNYIRGAWKDLGRDAVDYQFDGAAYLESAVPLTGPVTVRFLMHPMAGSSTYRADIYEFKINAGSIAGAV